MRQRMVRGTLQFRAALAEHPILHLAHEFRAFFHDRLVSRAVDVVGLEARLFKGVEELIGGEGTGFRAEFFGDGHADGGRGMCHHNEVGVGEHLFDFVDEAHLFDRIEGAAHQALAAGEALLIVNLVLGTDAAVDGVHRADLAARVAGFALVLINLDDPAQFAFAQITDKIRAVFAAAAGLRGKRRDFDCLSCHLTGLLITRGIAVSWTAMQRTFCCL